MYLSLNIYNSFTTDFFKTLDTRKIKIIWDFWKWFVFFSLLVFRTLDACLRSVHRLEGIYTKPVIPFFYFTIVVDLFIPHFGDTTYMRNKHLVLLGLYMSSYQLYKNWPPYVEFFQWYYSKDYINERIGWILWHYFFTFICYSLNMVAKSYIGISFHVKNKLPMLDVVTTSGIKRVIRIHASEEIKPTGFISRHYTGVDDWNFEKCGDMIFIKWDLFFNLLKENNNFLYNVLISHAIDFSCDINKIVVESDEILVYYTNVEYLNDYSCYERCNINYMKLFKVYYHRQISKNNLRNHISENAFPGSTKIMGYAAIFCKHLGYFGKDLTKLKIKTNTNEPLKPMDYTERLETLNNWLDTLEDSGNKRRMGNYLRRCVKWYHGLNHRGQHVTVEYKMRWKSHLDWILSSPVVAVKVDFFQGKDDVSRVFSDKITQLSNETPDKLDKYKHRKINKPIVYTTEFKTNNHSLESTVETIETDIKHVAKVPPGMIDVVLYSEIHKRNSKPKLLIELPCSTCNKVHEFKHKDDPELVGKARKTGKITSWAIKDHTEKNEDEWVLVKKTCKKQFNPKVEETVFKNQFAVLSNLKIKEEKTNYMPMSLSPFLEDRLRIEADKKVLKQQKGERLKRSKGKTIKNKDKPNLIRENKKNIYPNNHIPKCSVYKRHAVNLNEERIITVEQGLKTIASRIKPNQSLSVLESAKNGGLNVKTKYRLNDIISKNFISREYYRQGEKTFDVYDYD